MSGSHWTATGLPLDCHWAPTGLPLGRHGPRWVAAALYTFGVEGACVVCHAGLGLDRGEAERRAPASWVAATYQEERASCVICTIDLEIEESQLALHEFVVGLACGRLLKALDGAVCSASFGVNHRRVETRF